MHCSSFINFTRSDNGCIYSSLHFKINFYMSLFLNSLKDLTDLDEETLLFARVFITKSIYSSETFRSALLY